MSSDKKRLVTGVSGGKRLVVRSEPTACDILVENLHPGVLLPSALINASTGLIQSTSFVFALLLNQLIQLGVDRTSHHQVGIAVLFAFFVYLLASYLGAALVQLGKKWRYDILSKRRRHKFDYDLYDDGVPEDTARTLPYMV